jgi:hypothetical protein
VPNSSSKVIASAQIVLIISTTWMKYHTMYKIVPYTTTMFVTQCVISIFKQEVGHFVHARQAMQFSTRERAEIEAEDVHCLPYVE